MARATQPVSIDGIEFDALMEETRSYEADVPAYPVESGFEITDTIILKPLSLSMTLFLTNTPVTWKYRHSSGTSRVQDVLKELEELYFKKKVVTIITSERTYQNMAILSIELTKTPENGTSREIPIMFQEVRITESRTTSIPDNYGKGGATGTNYGTASITTSSTPVSSSSQAKSPSTKESASSDAGGKSSILFNLAQNSGLL